MLVSAVVSLAQGKQGFYTYGVLGHKFGSTYTTIPIESNQYLKNRLGGGNTLTGALGYMFHPNLGIEVSTTSTLGIRHQIVLDSKSIGLRSKNLHTVGSFIAQAPIYKFFLYVRAGVVLGWSNQTYMTEFSQTVGTTYKIQSGFMRGYNGSLGILIPIEKNLSFLFEAEEVSVQGDVQEAELIYSEGALNLPSQIEFVESLEGRNSTTELLYKAVFPISYSNIGFNIGLHYSF